MDEILRVLGVMFLFWLILGVIGDLVGLFRYYVLRERKQG